MSEALGGRRGILKVLSWAGFRCSSVLPRVARFDLGPEDNTGGTLKASTDRSFSGVLTAHN